MSDGACAACTASYWSLMAGPRGALRLRAAGASELPEYVAYLRSRVSALERAVATRSGRPPSQPAADASLVHTRGPFTRTLPRTRSSGGARPQQMVPGSGTEARARTSRVGPRAERPLTHSQSVQAGYLMLERGGVAGGSLRVPLDRDTGVPRVRAAQLRGEIPDEYGEHETRAFIADYVRKVRPPHESGIRSLHHR